MVHSLNIWVPNYLALSQAPRQRPKAKFWGDTEKYTPKWIIWGPHALHASRSLEGIILTWWILQLRRQENWGEQNSLRMTESHWCLRSPRRIQAENTSHFSWPCPRALVTRQRGAAPRHPPGCDLRSPKALPDSVSHKLIPGVTRDHRPQAPRESTKSYKTAITLNRSPK